MTCSDTISIAVEGMIDQAVMERLLSMADKPINAVYGRKGKPQLLSQLPKLIAASKYGNLSMMAIVDLDADDDCPVVYRQKLLPQPLDCFVLVVATRTIESWLLADRPGLARFLRCPRENIPAQPELHPDPKGVMVGLGATSKSHQIRTLMQPRPGSGRSTGPGYAGKMMDFASNHWAPDQARPHSSSLDYVMKKLGL